MKLVRNNLTELFRYHHGFAFMIILTQIMCTFSVFFAIGVLYNNQYVVLEDRTRTLKINIEFMGNDVGQLPSYNDVQNCLEEIYGLMEGALRYVDFLTNLIDDDGHVVSIASSGEWGGGTYQPSEVIDQTLYHQIYEGRNLTIEDYTENRFVTLATSNYTETVVQLYGQVYSVIGHRQKVLLDTDPIIFYIPPTTWNNIPLGVVQLNLLRLPTKQEYLHICDILNKSYEGQYTISDYYAGDVDFKALYISLGIALGGIMLVALWTMAMLYNYIYERRQWKMTIYSLCGCSRWNNIKMCLLEVLCLSMPSCGMGVIIFFIVCRLFLNKMYRYIQLLFTGSFVAGLFLTIVLLFIVENALLIWIRSGVSIKNRMMEI